MGVEIEYFVQNKMTNKMAFADHGGMIREYVRDSNVKLLVVSNLEGNKGTVFVIGNTEKVRMSKFQGIFDREGLPAKTKPIDNAKRDAGVYFEVEGVQELSIEMQGEERENSMRIFLCDFSQILAERMSSPLT
jgi:hypothetical protein